ncbi:MAG: glycoside hydrolase family 13 protein [Candidatus Sericytochromatia bacterium]
MKKSLALSLSFLVISTSFACKNNNSETITTEENSYISSTPKKGESRTTGNNIFLFAKNNAKVKLQKSGSIKGDGIYSDQTELYFSDTDVSRNENVKVKLRSYKDNLDSASISFSDGRNVEMKKDSTVKNDIFDFWVADVNSGSSNSRYKFVLKSGNDTAYYDALGFSGNDRGFDVSFFMTPDFKTPDWGKDAIYYQIFVDRFYNGNTKNDVKDNEYMFPYPEDPNNQFNNKVKAMKWGDLPEQPAKNRDFFGGDIEGVRQKLPYLQSLGINTIYFNPIFTSPSNHKYDTQDYRTIDPHFASNEEFKNFVKEAHSKGFKVVLDGVFNHTGSWHRWFDRAGKYDTVGAFENQSSPWIDFYNFSQWPKNYISWWGFDTLPKLNYASSKLRGEVYGNSDSIAKTWIKEYGIDGWRLDVPNEAGPNGGSDDHSIWKGFRQAVKSANPNAIIHGELWKGAQPFLQGDEFDGVMNYEGFADAVSTYMNEGFTIETTQRERITPSTFDTWIRSVMAKTPSQSNYVLMNLLSSHDTSRFMFRAKDDEWKAYEAVIFQMTFIGAPMIYYGDEIGMTGGKDPDCRRTFNWNFNKGDHLPQLYKKMIAIRKNNSALRRGTFETLLTDDNNGIYSYSRMDKKNKVLVILNNTSATKTVTVNVAKMGLEKGAVLKEELNNTSLSARTVKVDDNYNVTLPVYGHYGAIFTMANSK